ncbi:MAG: hypothetical protein PHY56_00145 [Candidatus Omnitrophica bacterium]|nr:hypothetical protein [Candidatus Omnitrophota bacterium]
MAAGRKKLGREEFVSVAIYIPVSLMGQIKAKAAEQMIAVSQYLRMLIVKNLNNK